MPEPAGFPQRPMLRPGVRVTRRDPHHLQVGLDVDPMVVRDEPAVRAVLAALERHTMPRPSSAAGQRFCAELLDHGLVVDAAALERARLLDRVDAHAMAAVFARHGHAAPEILSRRARARVGVWAPERAEGVVAQLLDWAGLSRDESRDQQCDVRLLVAIGETARGHVDELVRRGEPHLLVTAAEGRVRVGPFVVPGATACQRCLDAHLADADPRRPLVVEQYAAQAGPVRDDGVPEPVDLALLLLSLAWATRDLVAFLDGERPATWSTTVHVDPELTLVRTPWRRHPRCGCSWGEGLAVG